MLTGCGPRRGELLALCVDSIQSERTVARHLSRTQRRGDAGKTWVAFLHHHREALVAFGRLADSVATLAKDAHVAVEGELCTNTSANSLSAPRRHRFRSRVWEIRADSVLKLDRVAKRESNDDNDAEVPR